MLRGYALVLMSAVGFGLIPLLATWAYGDGVDVPTVLLSRFGVAASVLWLLCLSRGWVTRVPRRTVLMTLAAGAAYFLQSMAFFVAVRELGGGLASLLLYLYPCLVAVASALAARTVPSLLVVLSLVLSFVGIGLALGHLSGGGSRVGLLAGVATATAYTGYVFLSHHLGGHLHPLLGSAFVCTFALLVSTVWATMTGGLHLQLAARSPFACVLVGLVGGALAIACFFAGVRVVGPTQASIVSTIEPVISVVGSALVFGAVMSGPQWLGAVLVLVGAGVAILAHAGQEQASGHGA